MTALTRIPPVLFALSVGITQLGAPMAVASTPTATVLTLEGATLGPGVPAPWNASVTDGTICRNAACTAVPYPSDLGFLGIPFGVHDLDEALDGSTGNTVVLGYSLGAIVASEWLIANAHNPDAPDPSKVSFILMGNAARAHGGSGRWMGMVLPQTQYHVTDVTRQYDWLGDFPDNPLNLVALANAAAGYLFIHTDYSDVDLDDPDNVTWTEGNTTYVFVPTKNLPLLEPLRMVGMDALADELNGPLKAIVEAGYHRDLPETSAAQLAASDDTPDAVAAPTSKDAADIGGQSDTDALSAVAAAVDKPVRKPLHSRWHEPAHAGAAPARFLRKLRVGIDTALEKARKWTSPLQSGDEPPAPQRTRTGGPTVKPSRGTTATEHSEHRGRLDGQAHDE